YPALRRDPAARRPHDDHAQDARRRHRRGLRPARRRGRRPHAPHRAPAEGGARVIRVLALCAFALLAACATKTEGPVTAETAVPGESGESRNRARLHTELAGAYYERGNMGVALEE